MNNPQTSIVADPSVDRAEVAPARSFSIWRPGDWRRWLATRGDSETPAPQLPWLGCSTSNTELKSYSSWLFT